MPSKSVQTSQAQQPAARRSAIVTGGAGAGIGHGITEALAVADWNVLIVDQDADQAADLQQRLRFCGGTIEILIADITVSKTSQVAVEKALHTFGRLDGLVNNAGIGLCKPLIEIDDAEFGNLLAVDLYAAFRFCRSAIPAMLSRGGSIVNIGSVHAHRTIRGYSAYGCVKAALEGLTRGLAVDYGPEGVRANCVHPGLVSSPQNYELIRSFSSNPDEWLSQYAKSKQLIPTLVTPRQVGDLVAWLLGSQSATMTGQSLTLDGGSSAMLYERESQP